MTIIHIGERRNDLVRSKVLHVSARSLETFVTCPRRYALEYIQKAPPARRTTIPKDQVNQLVRRAIFSFHRRGGWITQGFGSLLADLAKGWDRIHFEDRAQAVNEFSRAQEMLVNFFEARFLFEVGVELGLDTFLAWERPHRSLFASGTIDRAVLKRDGTFAIVEYILHPHVVTPSEMLKEPQALLDRTIAVQAIRSLQARAVEVTFQYLMTDEVVSIQYTLQEFEAGWLVVDGLVALIEQGLHAIASGIPIEGAFPQVIGGHCLHCPMLDICQTSPHLPAKIPNPSRAHLVRFNRPSRG